VSIVEDEARQKELVELLREHIGKLEAGNWEITQIQKIGQQVVAGMNYFYYGTFGDRHENKIYAATVTLYVRPWDRYVEGKTKCVEKKAPEKYLKFNGQKVFEI
jgi:hypothetical protein